MKRALTDIFNWVNVIGSTVAAYALLNPNAASDLLNLLPQRLHTPAALLLPAAWFIFVQILKARAIQKGAGNAS